MQPFKYARKELSGGGGEHCSEIPSLGRYVLMHHSLALTVLIPIVVPLLCHVLRLACSFPHGTFDELHLNLLSEYCYRNTYATHEPTAVLVDFNRAKRVETVGLNVPVKSKKSSLTQNITIAEPIRHNLT